MLIVKTMLKYLVPAIGIVFVLLGCSAVNTENPSEQNAPSTANVTKITCGLKTYEVKTDSLTTEQREEIEQLKTRCRVNNVAQKLDRQLNIGGIRDVRLDDPNTKHQPQLMSNRK